MLFQGVAEQRVCIAMDKTGRPRAEVGCLEDQQRCREPLQVAEHQQRLSEEARGRSGGLWQVKQQRAACPPAGTSLWPSPESLQEGRKGSGWDST